MLIIGLLGLSSKQQRWQNDYAVELQFGVRAKPFTFPYIGLQSAKGCAAKQMATSSSNNDNDFQSVLPI